MADKKNPLLPTVITIATIGVAAGAALLARKRSAEIKGFLVANILERPAGRSSYTELAQTLEKSGVLLAQRAERAADQPDNRELLTHIIGIERWGQNRLRVALQQRPFERDDYQGYRPTAARDLQQLRSLMVQTRSQTVDLARQLHRSPPDDDFVVEHNNLGPLTAKGWLRYLNHHADLESRRLHAGQRSEAEAQVSEAS